MRPSSPTTSARLESVLGADKLVRYCALAGEAALAARAPEQALVHFERALAAKADGPTDDEAAEVLFGLGRAQLATLRHDRAGARGRELACAPSSTTSRWVTSAARSRSPPIRSHLSFRFGYTDAAELIARGLTLAPPGSHEAGRTARPARRVLGVHRGDYDPGAARFRQALSIAERDERLDHRAEDARQCRLRRRVPSPLARLPRRRGCGRSSWPRQDGDAQHRDPRPQSGRICSRRQRESASRARLHQPRHRADLAEQLRESWWLTSTSFSNQLLCLYEGDWRDRARDERARSGCGAA